MSNQVCPAILTRIDVYETLCPQQMLVHKGSQFNNEQLITGVGCAEMSHLQNCNIKVFKEHYRYFTKNNNKNKKNKMKKEEENGVG